jgi:hypothetical protein
MIAMPGKIVVLIVLVAVLLTFPPICVDQTLPDFTPEKPHTSIFLLDTGNCDSFTRNELESVLSKYDKGASYNHNAKKLITIGTGRRRYNGMLRHLILQVRWITRDYSKTVCFENAGIVKLNCNS